MKRLFYLLVMILIFSTILNAINYNDYSDELKIKITSYDGGYTLRSNDGFYVMDGDNIIDTIYDKEIVLKDEYGTFITSATQNYGPYYNARLRGVNGIINFKNNNYNGDFYLLKKDASLINVIDMENYIYSVVANEVGSTFEIESIKAQAVAARTYALHNSRKFIADGYNLTSDAVSQVYNGHKKVDQKITDAVNATKGEVILYNGEVIDATYSSTNGGVIASAKDTWGEARDYLISKTDPYSLNSPRVNWDYNLSLNDIDSRLSKGTNKTNFKSLVFHVNDLGRVANVEINYDDKTFKITGERFRSRMGVSNLKSTNFKIYGEPISSSNGNRFNNIPNSCLIDENASGNTVVTIFNTGNNDTIKFIGKGVGHGVGMSQYGANEMAKKNFNYLDILKFYYEGVQIEKIYD